MILDAERWFHRDMVRGVDRLKREIGYNASRFLQMVGELGGVETARRLARTRGTSEGFATLWQHGRLDMSVEAHMLLPWYRHLFEEDEASNADQKLRAHDFDVDTFLRRAEREPPPWASVIGIVPRNGDGL